MIEGWFSRAKDNVVAPASSKPATVHDVPVTVQTDSQKSLAADNVGEWKDHNETEEERRARLRVEGWRDELFRSSEWEIGGQETRDKMFKITVRHFTIGPMVRFMVRHLSLVSCDPFAPSDVPSSSELSRINIAACPPNIAGGFAPTDPKQNSSILICANRIMDKGHLENTLTHEMIHWWDHCRFKVDWFDYRQHACSEIRAASLSGDCRMGREWNRGHFAFTKQHQACTRRRAVVSLMGRSDFEATREDAEKAVDEVFDKCFADTRPFDEIY